MLKKISFLIILIVGMIIGKAQEVDINNEIKKKVISGLVDVNNNNLVEGESLLHYFAIDGNKEMTEFLIKHGADVNLKNFTEGRTPLMYAVYNKNNEVAKILLQNGADANIAENNGTTALMHASSSGNLKGVKLLIDDHADVNVKNDDDVTALLFAARADHSDIIKTLLNAGANINATDYNLCNALHFSLIYNNSKMAAYLIKKGIDIYQEDRNGVSAFMIILVTRNYDVLKKIRKVIVIGEADKKNIMNCITDSVYMMKIMIDYIKLDIEAVKSVEHLKEIIQILTGAGLDVNEVGADGKTMLMGACEQGDLRSVKYFMKMNANTNPVDEKNFSCIHYAVMGGNLDIVEKLLENHVDINLRGGEELITPLDIAKQKGNEKMVNLLVSRGAIKGDLN
jgi:ankyrin repeat protein